MTTSCFEGGWATTEQAEQEFTDLDLPDSLACTHFVPGCPEAVVSTGILLEGGRAFVFEGSRSLPRVLEVDDLLARTPISGVRAVGGGDISGADLIDTQDFLRPVVTGGQLVLHLRPAAEGCWVPFEQPHPTPCCADH